MWAEKRETEKGRSIFKLAGVGKSHSSKLLGNRIFRITISTAHSEHVREELAVNDHVFSYK
jgi:hypothetical protein